MLISGLQRSDFKIRRQGKDGMDMREIAYVVLYNNVFCHDQLY